VSSCLITRGQEDLFGDTKVPKPRTPLLHGELHGTERQIEQFLKKDLLIRQIDPEIHLFRSSLGESIMIDSLRPTVESAGPAASNHDRGMVVDYNPRVHPFQRFLVGFE